MNRALIKARAKEFAFNNKWNCWKVTLLMTVIIYAFTFLFSFVVSNFESPMIIFISLIIFEFAMIPMSIGMNYYMIKLVRGEKIDPFNALFSKYNLTGLIILVTIGVAVCTYLWSLLLLIPGIIYAFKVIMAPFLLADVANEQTTYSNVINASKYMMDGYKLDLFIFNLSFIGWIFLVM